MIADNAEIWEAQTLTEMTRPLLPCEIVDIPIQTERTPAAAAAAGDDEVLSQEDITLDKATLKKMAKHLTRA